MCVLLHDSTGTKGDKCEFDTDQFGTYISCPYFNIDLYLDTRFGIRICRRATLST